MKRAKERWITEGFTDNSVIARSTRNGRYQEFPLQTANFNWGMESGGSGGDGR